MVKRFLILLISLCLLIVAPNAAFASPYLDDDLGNACALTGYTDPLLCGTSGGNEEAEIQKKVINVINTVYLWIGILAIVVIVIAGIKYMTSQGNPEAVKKAKTAIMYAAIGLIVTLSAFAITLAITKAIQGQSLTSSTGSGADGGGGGGAGTSTYPVESLQIIANSPVLAGNTIQVKVKILPDYATDKTITFASSNTSVATITNAGLLTAVAEGETTITVTASNGVTASKTITVIKPIEVDTVTLDPASVTIKINKTTTIKATVSPSNAADKSLTWKSSDSTIATVTSSGTVKGIKEGTVTITAEAKNGKKGTATVKVEPNETKYAAAFEQKHYTASNGQSFDYILNVPDGATSNMPLLVFLHGDGEVGNPAAVKNLKQTQYAHGSKKFIFIAPVTTVYDWTAEKIQVGLKDLIDKTISDYKINTKKVYLMGFSRGAIGTWTMVNRYPNLFAATVPVSCCGTVDASKYKTTKVYALAGGYESGYISCMRGNVNSINGAGGSAKFEEVAGQTHSSITGAFPYEKVIDNWLLQQSR